MRRTINFKPCLQAKSIYDFMSMSLDILISNVDKPIRFIYRINDDKGESESIRTTLCEKLSEPEDDPEIIQIINDIFTNACRSDNSTKHQLDVIYAILQGINMAAKLWDDNKFNIWGPLDKRRANRYHVYLRPSLTLLDDFEEQVYRERNKQTAEFLASLDRFIFLDKKALNLVSGQKVPKGILIRPNIKDWSAKKLRVGISPFCCDQNFEFDLENIREDVLMATVNHSKVNQDSFVLKAKKILEKASDNKCDIVVFPEYACSKKIKYAISSGLKDLKNKHKHRPDLVFAGTTWTEKNENKLYVFGSEGQIVGRYSKRCNFDNTNDFGVRVIEDIEQRWNENVFFCLPSIGYIMPVICKDAIDENGPADLFSEWFSPLLIVIPAWSPSVNSFDRLALNSTDNFTSYVVADSCSAVFKGSEPFLVGKYYIVNKVGSLATGKPYPVKISSCDKSKCEDGCLIIRDFDFSYESGKTKRDEPKKNTSVDEI